MTSRQKTGACVNGSGFVDWFLPEPTRVLTRGSETAQHNSRARLSARRPRNTFRAPSRKSVTGFWAHQQFCYAPCGEIPKTRTDRMRDILATSKPARGTARRAFWRARFCACVGLRAQCVCARFPCAQLLRVQPSRATFARAVFARAKRFKIKMGDVVGIHWNSRCNLNLLINSLARITLVPLALRRITSSFDSSIHWF